MRYSPLGSTGLRVSALAYGASALGALFGPIDEADALRSVHAALDGGVNLIDCAPFYGLTQAETLLGKALTGIPRDRYILATKAGRFGWEAFDFSEAAIVRSAEDSMRRLGVDYLDILQLHDIEYHGRRYLSQALEEGIPALQKLKDAGVIRFYGVTAYPVAVLAEVMQAVALDTLLCHNHYTLADTQLCDLLPLAGARGVGVIAASPLGTGLLTERGPAEWHPASEAERKVVRQAARLCRERGTSIERLALQFATANPAVPTTLVSCPSSEQARANLAAVAESVDWDLVAQVQSLLAPIADRDWNFGG
jgi:L-galactose dehydrogenase